MKPHALILLLLSLLGANLRAQTPYDAFAPETSRPMLGLDAINMMENPSQCNVINDSIWSMKLSTDNVSKWLSPDPLLDKYPSISSYAYCNWNPLKYVDQDGKGVFPSKEALRQAGENVVNNPNYQRQGRTTFCNIGAQAINAQAGDRSLLGRANEMGISLRNPEIATEISQSEALEYANMGAVVFASYVSNGGEPGHIAIVAPTEGLTYSPTRNESVVSVFNVGSQNGEMPLSYAFGKRSVGMFILNNDLNTLKGISTSNGGNFQEIPVGGINEIVVTGKGTTKLEVPIKAIDVKLPNANLNL